MTNELEEARAEIARLQRMLGQQRDAARGDAMTARERAIANAYRRLCDTAERAIAQGKTTFAINMQIDSGCPRYDPPWEAYSQFLDDYNATGEGVRSDYRTWTQITLHKSSEAQRRHREASLRSKGLCCPIEERFRRLRR